MSVPVPLIGKATIWRQPCQPIRAKTCSPLREMTGQNQPELPEIVPYRQQGESTVEEEHVTCPHPSHSLSLRKLTSLSMSLISPSKSLSAIINCFALLWRWNKEKKLFMPSHSRRFESHIDCRLVYVARFRIATILASDWSIPWLL